MSGRVIYTAQTTVQGHKEIVTAALSKARIYLLKVETTDRTESFKIVKE